MFNYIKLFFGKKTLNLKNLKLNYLNNINIENKEESSSIPSNQNKKINFSQDKQITFLIKKEYKINDLIGLFYNIKNKINPIHLIMIFCRMLEINSNNNLLNSYLDLNKIEEFTNIVNLIDNNFDDIPIEFIIFLNKNISKYKYYSNNTIELIIIKSVILILENDLKLLDKKNIIITIKFIKNYMKEKSLNLYRKEFKKLFVKCIRFIKNNFNELANYQIRKLLSTLYVLNIDKLYIDDGLIEKINNKILKYNKLIDNNLLVKLLNFNFNSKNINNKLIEKILAKIYENNCFETVSFKKFNFSMYNWSKFEFENKYFLINFCFIIANKLMKNENIYEINSLFYFCYIFSLKLKKNEYIDIFFGVINFKINQLIEKNLINHHNMMNIIWISIFFEIENTKKYKELLSQVKYTKINFNFNNLFNLYCKLENEEIKSIIKLNEINKRMLKNYLINLYKKELAYDFELLDKEDKMLLCKYIKNLFKYILQNLVKTNYKHLNINNFKDFSDFYQNINIQKLDFENENLFEIMKLNLRNNSILIRLLTISKKLNFEIDYDLKNIIIDNTFLNDLYLLNDLFDNNEIYEKYLKDTDKPDN